MSSQPRSTSSRDLIPISAASDVSAPLSVRCPGSRLTCARANSMRSSPPSSPGHSQNKPSRCLSSYLNTKSHTRETEKKLKTQAHALPSYHPGRRADRGHKR
ncbi:hypothetical protein BC937DRAFT_88987 [Endogone sp. FLAS-F59071]|nr:hypothetical protein BC937DRAFT_88987 [Endogone sp. FLAS-F59071]|eukprot:RUS18253.1 hypothetical protein BC937DRAFT_88987 [Endogone sp. FLAS-F59071]